MVHPIMKSALGLDTFMKYKVENFFKKLDLLMKKNIGIVLESEEQINHLFTLMIRFISSTLLYNNSNNQTNLPDHYIVAKNQLPKYLSYFDKQELLETCLEECKSSQNIFNLISDYINENYQLQSEVTNDQQIISSMTKMNNGGGSTNSTTDTTTTTNNNNNNTTITTTNSNILDTIMVSSSGDQSNGDGSDIQSPIPLISVINKENQWIKIPPTPPSSCKIDQEEQQQLESELFKSLFGNEIYSQIPNTNQVLNLSSLKSLSHYLINNSIHTNNTNNLNSNKSTFNETTTTSFKSSILLKQGCAHKKDVKSFFQNYSKMKKRHILLVRCSTTTTSTTGNNKQQSSVFKLVLFNADGSNNEIFHNEMKPIEEIELSNLCYLTINDQPKKNISVSSPNTLTVNDRTEKKKWLFEFNNAFERDEWFYMLKYCLLLC